MSSPTRHDYLCLSSRQSLAAPSTHDSVSQLLGLCREHWNSLRIVMRHVDRLPIELVVALWLDDVCELSYADAASDAGVRRETLASRLHRARRAIALDIQAAIHET